MLQGCSVFEAGAAASDAADEINQLVDEVVKL
jgi:hypothetical protein